MKKYIKITEAMDDNNEVIYDEKERPVYEIAIYEFEDDEAFEEFKEFLPWDLNRVSQITIVKVKGKNEIFM